MSVNTQGENTTAWIGVTVRNEGAACVLPKGSAGIRLVIELGGRRAAVAGNPLTLSLSGGLMPEGTRLLIGDWRNWCGSRRGVSLLASFSGSVIRSHFSVLPVCLNRGSVSRLVAVP